MGCGEYSRESRNLEPRKLILEAESCLSRILAPLKITRSTAISERTDKFELYEIPGNKPLAVNSKGTLIVDEWLAEFPKSSLAR